MAKQSSNPIQKTTISLIITQYLFIIGFILLLIIIYIGIAYIINSNPYRPLPPITQNKINDSKSGNVETIYYTTDADNKIIFLKFNNTLFFPTNDPFKTQTLNFIYQKFGINPNADSLTIDYFKDLSSYYLRVNGRKVAKYDDINWMPLLDYVQTNLEGDFFTALLDFQQVSNPHFNFIFIVATSVDNDRDMNYDVYIHTIDNTVEKIATFTPEFMEKYNDIKITDINDAGNFIAFEMFSTGYIKNTYPATILLLNTETKMTKDIGNKPYFKWLKKGEYQFKNYIKVSCSEANPYKSFMDCAGIDPDIKVDKF